MRMEKSAYKEIIEKEEKILAELYKTLIQERKGIISSSLEEINMCGIKKEEILRQINNLDKERKDMTDDMIEEFPENIVEIVKKIRFLMDRNMKLMTFAIKQKKYIIDEIINKINLHVYPGKEKTSTPLMLMKEV
ncbi:MAG: hypothetical protein PHI15_09900 [Methanomicrobium sp.]|nr:hypothetical protein [Methanomicrobium sp.]